jgi:hypothetical protein
MIVECILHQVWIILILANDDKKHDKKNAKDLFKDDV